MAKNWAEIPRELLGKIMKRLCINSIDSFKMVCHPWHSAVQEEVHLSLLRSIAPSPPWLTIPEEKSESEADADEEEEEKKKKKNVKKKDLSARFFNPTNKKVYFFQNEEMKRWLPDLDEAVCVGSSHGWLAFVDTRCVIYLINPFKKPDIESSSSSPSPSSSSKYIRRIQLPSIETLPCILGVEREYSSPSGGIIIDFEYYDHSDQSTYTAPSNDTYHFFIYKLVVSSAFEDDDDDNEYIVMAIYGELNDLAFCRSGDTSWTPLNNSTLLANGRLANYEDIYYSTNDQRFYAYRRDGISEIWDLPRDPSSAPKCTRIDSTLESRVPPSLDAHEEWLRYSCGLRRYLVKFCGDLLLVVRYLGKRVTENGEIYTEQHATDNVDSYNSTLRFDVYKLDWVKKQWVYVKCIGNGDGVLFLGLNNAMTFSVCDFPTLRGNSIYFTDDNTDEISVDGSEGGHDLGIFCLDDNYIHPCFYPGNSKRITPPPVWISPKPW